MKKISLFILACFCWLHVFAQEKTEGIQKSLEEFNQDKFGMFIHWGPYSMFGGDYKGKTVGGGAEWIQQKLRIPADEYEPVVREFNPVKFDAEKWVKLAKEAGMKYIVFTTKHHDGFCMFDSKYTDYDLLDYTAFKRDVVKELAEACRKYGIKLGLYYSIVDWHHPEFPARYSNHGKNFHGRPNPNADISKYADYEIAQVRELMTNYGDVSTIWFDGGGAFQNADRYALLKGDSIVSLIRSLQPSCLINSRIGGKADYGNPEQKIPGTIQDQAFEVCMTMNSSWGYKSSDQNWKSTDDLILKLIDIAHKGGNFLLNVGPDGAGVIPQPSTERLEAIGSWLKSNGEAIYGTKNSLWEEPSWGKSTTRRLPDGNTRIYLHVTTWPPNGTIAIPDLKNKPIIAFLLAEGENSPLKIKQSRQSIRIQVPANAPNKLITTIVLDVEGTPSVVTIAKKAEKEINKDE
jgi:alpha-L-fucosidase